MKASPISTQAPNYIVENSDSFPGLTPLEHTGVMCDRCNTEPIIGPRFRAYASYKENYNLCERCFSGSTCTLDQFEFLDVMYAWWSMFVQNTWLIHYNVTMIASTANP